MGTSIREALESAISTQEAKESTITSAPEVEQVETVQPAATEVPIGETAEQRAERLRDEKGRFIEGKAKPVEKASDKPVEKIENVVEPVVKKIPKPDSWKKEYQSDWDALTPRQQEYVKAREDQYFKGISTYQQEWKSAKPLLDAMAPFLPELEANKIKPDEWISRLGNAHYTLVRGNPQQKLQMFSQLARDYGVPLQALFDPNVAQQFVQQTIQQPQRPEPQRDIASLVRQEILQAKSEEEIMNFENAKDTSGNPLYPHYQTVKGDMALLLESGKAQDLKHAYNMALRLHDDLFEAEMEAKRKADDTARQEAQRKAVAAAKGSAVSVRSATPATTGAEPKGSRREILSDAWDQHMSGRI